jgi:hypothetical protein
MVISLKLKSTTVTERTLAAIAFTYIQNLA